MRHVAASRLLTWLIALVLLAVPLGASPHGAVLLRDDAPALVASDDGDNRFLRPQHGLDAGWRSTQAEPKGTEGGDAADLKALAHSSSLRFHIPTAIPRAVFFADSLGHRRLSAASPRGPPRDRRPAVSL